MYKWLPFTESLPCERYEAKVFKLYFRWQSIGLHLCRVKLAVSSLGISWVTQIGHPFREHHWCMLLEVSQSMFPWTQHPASLLLPSSGSPWAEQAVSRRFFSLRVEVGSCLSSGVSGSIKIYDTSFPSPKIHILVEAPPANYSNIGTQGGYLKVLWRWVGKEEALCHLKIVKPIYLCSHF